MKLSIMLVATLFALGCAQNQGPAATPEELDFDLSSVNVDSPADVPTGTGVRTRSSTLPFSSSLPISVDTQAHVIVVSARYSTSVRLEAKAATGRGLRGLLEVYESDGRSFARNPIERVRITGARVVKLDVELEGGVVGRAAKKFAIVIRSVGSSTYAGAFSLAATKLSHSCAEFSEIFESRCATNDPDCLKAAIATDEHTLIDECCSLGQFEYCAPTTCSPVLCEIYCPFGFKTNSAGCEICSCAERPSCNNEVVCALWCPYGFANGANGCPTCTCADRPTNTCSPVTCELYCPNGFQRGANGCEVCRCR